MPTVKLGVDSETYTRLMESAGVERRPVAMQAEVLQLAICRLTGCAGCATERGWQLGERA